MAGKPSAVEENVKSRDDGERVNRAVDDGDCLFIFIVVIVLLNVLIAIVGTSYEEARDNSVGIYYRLKIELITDTAPIASRLPAWMLPTTDKVTVKKDLAATFEKFKEKASKDETVELIVKRALRDTRSELDETQQELTATRTKLVHVEEKIDKLIKAILEYK
jgi:hypothetical protein